MNKIKLTITAIENLPYAEKGKQVDYYDTEVDGFGLRVSHTGKKYFVRHYVGGKRVRVMIGSHTKMAADAARKEAKKKLGLMVSGTDPNMQKKELKRLKEEKDAELTIKELGTEYIERHAKVKKKSWEEDKRILDTEIYPVWGKGKRKAADITKGDVIKLLEDVVDRGAPQTANNILKIIRKMFNWAVETNRLKISPCISVKMPAPTNEKKRALDPGEIKTFWTTLLDPGLSMTDEVKQSLRLILFTVQRPGEVSGMHTRELDLSNGWWIIPPERTKNKLPHLVPLSAAAQEIITEAIATAKAGRENAEIRNAQMMKREKMLTPEDQEYSGYVFPSSRRYKSKKAGGGKADEKPITRHALSKALKRHESEDGLTVMGLAPFTPHDLRRSGNTLMASCKVIKEYRERVLNHTLEKLDGTYNLYDYADEKQVALEALARKLDSILNGSENKVIPFQRKAAGAE